MSQSHSSTVAMRGLPIPDDGIILGAPPPTVGNGKASLHGLQAMRIKFDENILNEIFQHQGRMGITFGKSMVRETPLNSGAIPFLFCWELTALSAFAEDHLRRSRS
jgi:hypothetical protein